MSRTSYVLTKLTPRHREIMIRMINGQKGKTIAEDLGISPNYLTIIRGSPLFQIELRKMMARREEKIFDIQENFLDAADLGVKFHKEVLEAQPGVYTTDTKMKSATTMSVLASRLLRPGVSQPSNGDGEEGGQSYEERLKRVTIEESVRTVSRPTLIDDNIVDVDKLLEGEYPPETELETGLEDDVLFGEMVEEDDIFTPPMKIEEILTQVSGEKG